MERRAVRVIVGGVEVDVPFGAFAVGDSMVFDGTSFVGSSYLTPAIILGSKLKLDLNADVGVVLGTGTAVASWADQSGNANNVAQGTVGARPTQILNAFDGHASIAFSGTQWIGALTFTGVAAGDTPHLYTIAVDTNGASNEAFISLASSATLNADGMYISMAGGSTYTVAFRSALVVTAYGSRALGFSAPALFESRSDAGAQVLAINGIDRATAAASGGLSTTINRVVIGQHVDGTQPFIGQQLRHVLVNPAPTATQHALLMSYFKQQYPSLGLP
jgi:hypothetical protein